MNGWFIYAFFEGFFDQFPYSAIASLTFTMAFRRCRGALLPEPLVRFQPESLPVILASASEMLSANGATWLPWNIKGFRCWWFAVFRFFSFMQRTNIVDYPPAS